jgi:hypothetical protein
MATGDPASLSAIAAYSALDTGSEDSTRLKIQTIRMVNSRLSNITEHLLFTVTLLWMIEVRTSILVITHH